MSERILGFLISPSQVSRRVAVLGVVALAASLAACGGSSDNASSNAGATATLAVLETTDLHFNVRSYDYFKLAEDKSYGFERTATLVCALPARSLPTRCWWTTATPFRALRWPTTRPPSCLLYTSPSPRD